MIKSLFATALVALSLAIATPATAASDGAAKQRVVLQVDANDEKVWKYALTLAENMQKNAGKDNIEIEIVAMSPGIHMVGGDSAVADRVSAAAANGILVRACGNTMKAVKWAPDKLAMGVEVVPFGALEIIDKQQAGWAYIKP